MGYGADKSWNIETAWNIFEANGIVYTRACITGFAEGTPPNNAPQSAGNTRSISSTTFLRGTVKPTVAQNSTSQLNLGPSAQMISADKKKLGYKNAVAGLTEAMTLGNWTFLAEVNWANDITFSTSSLSDGDYDLIVRSQNNRSHWDGFDPDFAGDSVASRNSDEKWLKHLHTWYNQDGDPSSDTEGKVIVDNTKPTVSNCKPQ